MDLMKLSDELCQLHITYAGAMNRVLSEVSAKGEDGIVLWLYSRHQETSPTDIVRHFSLSTGRVTNILRSLEKKQLLFRLHSPEDQRRVCVYLTDKGKNFAKETYTRMVERHAKLIELLGTEETVKFMNIMEHIMILAEDHNI